MRKAVPLPDETGMLMSGKDRSRLAKEKLILSNLASRVELSESDKLSVEFALSSTVLNVVEETINRVLDPKWTFSTTPVSVLEVYSQTGMSGKDLLELSEGVGIWATSWSLQTMPLLR